MLYFVYGLVDPALVDETSDGVGYVGITNNPNRRLLEHIEMRGVDGVKNGWIRHLLDNNIYPEMKILEIVDGDMEAARIREVYWVQHYQAPAGYYTAMQAKEKLDVSDGMLRTYIRDGKIAHFIPAGMKQGFYKQEDVDKLAREFNDGRKKLFERQR